MKRTQSIEIARSPDEVLRFSLTRETAGLAGRRRGHSLTPAPLGVGSHLREVPKVLGRRRVEITEFVVEGH